MNRRKALKGMVAIAVALAVPAPKNYPWSFEWWDKTPAMMANVSMDFGTEDFTIQMWARPEGNITDIRVTRGMAVYESTMEVIDDGDWHHYHVSWDGDHIDGKVV